MKRSHFIFIAICACASGVARADDSSTLTSICDQAAASPFDTTRPAGVAGVAPDKIDTKIAVPACEAAVKAAPNDPRIAYQLGRAYFAAKAYESARAQYERADAAGFAPAAFNLAAIYHEGLGVPVDPQRSIALVRRAADGGLPLAMNALGYRYTQADGVAKDLSEARRWFQKGAELNDPDSMSRYALCFWGGLGGEKNRDEARRWFQKAAEAGSPSGMTDYGEMLLSGEGGEKNDIEARHWFEKSSRGRKHRGHDRLRHHA
ncbi:MAG TPA: tetratricopeptide repeat protein [Xanthobacteraceae bacterium]|jgi:hypothetical protein